MIEVVITPEMISLARKLSDEMGALRNSITSGEGNLIGFLGEIVAHKVIGGMLDNTYHHDILLDDFMTTIDVKTKKTSVKPKDYYECSVAALNIQQKCDYYCFVRIKDDLSVGWYLGVCNKKKYFDKARLLRKGELDKDNNFIVKSDCYNMRIADLDAKIN